MNDWVTIAYQVGPVEITVLQDRFEEEGIIFIVSGENTPYPSLSVAQGGIKIQVMQNDEEWALEIVKEMGYLE